MVHGRLLAELSSAPTHRTKRKELQWNTSRERKFQTRLWTVLRDHVPEDGKLCSMGVPAMGLFWRRAKLKLRRLSDVGI